MLCLPCKGVQLLVAACMVSAKLCTYYACTSSLTSSPVILCQGDRTVCHQCKSVVQGLFALWELQRTANCARCRHQLTEQGCATAWRAPARCLCLNSQSIDCQWCVAAVVAFKAVQGSSCRCIWRHAPFTCHVRQPWIAHHWCWPLSCWRFGSCDAAARHLFCGHHAHIANEGFDVPAGGMLAA